MSAHSAASSDEARRTSRLFYLGTLVSSVGSFTLTVALVAFLKSSGYSLSTVGLVVAVSRFAPVVANLLLGQVVDRFEARGFLFVTELLAAGVGVVMYFAWAEREAYFSLFVVLIALRAALQGLGSTAIAKVAKGLSVQSGRNTVNALLLSVATNGATLFAGGIAWFAVTRLDFAHVIVFDVVTFLVNGLLAFVFVPKFGEATRAAATLAGGIVDKFRVLYASARRAVLLDALLAFSMAGLAATTARLVEDQVALIPVMMTLFGLSFWIAGYVLRLAFVRRHAELLWIVLALAFAGLSVLDLTLVPALLALAFLRDTAYAILYTKHTTDIQRTVPFHATAAAAAARTVQGVVILAVGELVVGAAAAYASVQFEYLVRALIAVAGCAGVLLAKAATHDKHDEKENPAA